MSLSPWEIPLYNPVVITVSPSQGDTGINDTAISTEGLVKNYGAFPAVCGIDLEIPRGEIFAFIGPNGAGKTTTLNMLATILEPTFGKAFIEGTDVWDDPVATRLKIGFMPDFFQVYRPLTVWEFLAYFGMAHGLGGSELRRRVEEVIVLIGLTDKRDKLCKGLSRGMVQRLGLGRAILHKPPVLLLDEPASGLDPLARMNLFSVLKQVNQQGTTIVISSHILSELSDLCTSVGIMHEGRFLAVGSRDEILRRISPKRKISIEVVGDADAAGRILADFPDVSCVEACQSRLTFMFEADNEALAGINGSLVQAGVQVATISEEQTTLSELYLSIAEGEANASA
ncbi:MAG: ABC transporter ATP-binding protein [Phycisphaerae bacterium]